MQFPSICAELQEKAKNELHEDHDKLEDNLNHLRQWISEQQHLNARTDDQWLLYFLRGSKFNLEKTKERIDVFYTCRTIIPEFFSNRDPSSSEVQEVLSRRIMTILPKTAGPAEPRLIFNRAGCAGPESVTVTNYAKAFFVSLDILCMEDPNLTIAGMSLIIDLKDMSYKYVAQITPSFIKKMLTCIQDAYPTRLKGIYFINAPVFFEGIYKLMKLFLNEKLKKRIHFYGKLKDCYKDIPASVFPKDYGGEQATCDELSDEWKLKVESYTEWLKNDEQYCTDEAKRPGKPKTAKKQFG